MKDFGLVLEGGGMRGVYTAGVLDFFMEMNLYFPYVIGTSAGACNATSYLSKQIGRNKKVLIDYIDHPNFFGVRNLFNERSLFGMNLIFQDIPKKCQPFNFDSFSNNQSEFIITTTDVETGKPYYINKNKIVKYYSGEERNNKLLDAVKASSSIPFISPTVKFDNKLLLDGGVVDSIPIKKAELDGVLRNVIVLTREKSYRKKPFKHGLLAKRIYNDKIANAMINRHNNYNNTLGYIEELEKCKKVFVIRPSKPLDIDTYSREKSKLNAVYDLGYNDAKALYEDLIQWLSTEGRFISKLKKENSLKIKVS